MKKFIQVLGSMTLLVLLLLLGMLPLHAQATAASNIGFYVQSIIPPNQMNPSHTYFDLRMEPGQSQTLEIEIVNEGTEDIRVGLDAVSASTNPYGVIDYTTPGIRDESLDIPFSDITTLHDTTVVVQAGGTSLASFTVNMPDKSYDGVVLGGIVLTKEDTDTTSVPGDSTVILNRYSYIIGVKLSETDAVVDPSFELLGVEASSANYEAALVHYIRNTQAAIVKGMELDVKVYREGQVAPVAHILKHDVDMAPNSVMELAATLLPKIPAAESSSQGIGTPHDKTEGSLQGSGNGGNTADDAIPTEGRVSTSLESGSYTSVVTLQYGGQIHTMERKFIVGEEMAETINMATQPAPQASSIPLPWWGFTLIGLSLLLTLIIILLLILLKRRRREDEEENQRTSVNPQHKR